jgi:DnaK suppressor protein
LLEKKRTELTSRLQSMRDRIGGDHPTLADPVERASESEEDAEEIGVANPDDFILAQVDRAIAKLEQGTYGLSEVSGEPLGFDRLQALPWATHTAREEEASEARRR